MSGSLKFQKYTGNDISAEGGATSSPVYLVKADESNGEVMGFDDATAADVGLEVIRLTGKRNQKLIPRYLLATGQTTGGKQVTRKFFVGKPDFTLFTQGGTFSALVAVSGTASESVTFQVTYAQGEAKQFFTAADTGLDDGDAT